MDIEINFITLYDNETPVAERNERWQLHFFKSGLKGVYCREPVGSRFYPTREAIKQHARRMAQQHDMCRVNIDIF